MFSLNVLRKVKPCRIQIMQALLRRNPGRAACSLFSTSLVSVRILKSLSSGSLLFLEFSSSCRAVCSLFSTLSPTKFSSLFGAVCSFFWNSLVPVERFAPCFQCLESLSKFSRLFRAVCSFLLKLSSSFRAVCSLLSMSLVSFDILKFISSGLLLFLELSSSFRAACFLFSTSHVSFERFAPFSETL